MTRKFSTDNVRGVRDKYQVWEWRGKQSMMKWNWKKRREDYQIYFQMDHLLSRPQSSGYHWKKRRGPIWRRLRRTLDSLFDNLGDSQGTSASSSGANNMHDVIGNILQKNNLDLPGLSIWRTTSRLVIWKGYSIPCKQCNKTFRTRNSLADHKHFYFHGANFSQNNKPLLWLELLWENISAAIKCLQKNAI